VKGGQVTDGIRLLRGGQGEKMGGKRRKKGVRVRQGGEYEEGDIDR